jgi:hypothetical protein
MSKSVHADSPSFEVRNVADLDTDREFVSLDSPGQWISWDLHSLIVNLTGYAIRGGSSSSPGLRSWKIEGSVDRVKWVELDNQSGFPDPIGGYGIHSFQIGGLPECRIIRLTMTGRSHGNNHVLAISGFEIFGHLRPGTFWELPPFRPIAVPVDVKENSKEPLRGILAYLTKQYKGCVHRLSAVIVTASSVAEEPPDQPGRYAASNASAVGDSSSFQSGSESGAWLCYDFYDKAVTVSSYTLKSRGTPDGGKGRSNLKSWRVDGSTDGMTWFQVDEQRGREDLDNRGALQTFPVTLSGEFRFIRLVLTGPNWSSRNVIWISAFELCGQLRCLTG